MELAAISLDDERDGDDVIDSRECLALLHTHTVGRVAFTDHNLPQVFPVTYAMDESTIVFRTRGRGRLAQLCRNAVVAFQVDSLGEPGRACWTVLAVGSSRVVTKEGERMRALALGIAPLALGSRHSFVRIVPGMLTGRRLGDPANRSSA